MYLKQDGIQPMWEDDSNKDGGRWLINLEKNKRSTYLDDFWLETVSTITYRYIFCICCKNNTEYCL